ncbi:MAG: L,D-transpeptidase family protein [Candidatus Accumulibacter sp.]|jgi:murein L,D-transpeptidase YcbB/YkuD|nr:L,D-transpeptidase family protein [Accumulibacter sp.]
MHLDLSLLAGAARYPLRGHIPALCLAIGLVSASSLAPAADAPLWFTEEGPTLAARQAVDLLVNAAADGLDRRDYNADWLRDTLAGTGSESFLTESRRSTLDNALTSAMRRYLADLNSGRIAPDQLGANYRPAASAGFDPDSVLYSAIANDRLADAARSAAPPLPQYASLRQALANYRQLAGDPTWKKDLPPLPAGRLSPGEKYGGLAELLQRLRLLDDLPNNGATPPRYDGQVVDAIKSFQARHALTPNGVIEANTFQQLNVPPATRVRQIELALERLRWTPLLPAPRAIVVNIPEFMLRAYEVRNDRIETRVAMKVIVGTARKHRTPLFDAEMQFIEFSPYWNVPPSIARSETLPRLRRDPGYFQRQGFEFVSSDGRVVGGFSESSLDAVQRGQMRIRQRPGAGNALGDIKFVFPNADNIYLHHTSTPRLFKRDRRDFSHGCIRVEDPVQLAKFVLAGEPEWTEQRIIQAMRKGKSATLRLDEGLPVVIAYMTAAVRDGRVHFFPDLYGHDRLLDDALRQRSQRLRASQASQFAAKSEP